MDKEHFIEYHINYLKAGADLVGAAIKMPEYTVIPETNEASNIWSFIDSTQRRNSYTFQLPSKKIEIIESEGQDYRIDKNFELFDIVSTRSASDYLDENGEVIMRRGTRTLELHMPRIVYSKIAKPIINDEFAGYFLSNIANSLRAFGTSDEQYISGLSSPHIARNTSRWGFSVSEKPFPGEIYRLFDVAMSNFEHGVNLDLASLKNEALFYQKTEDFLERFSPTGN